MLEYSNRVFEIEFLVHDTRRIDLDTVVCEFLFLCIEETTSFRIVREIEKRKYAESKSTHSLNKEQIPPIIQGSRLNLKHPKGKKSAKRRRN